MVHVGLAWFGVVGLNHGLYYHVQVDSVHYIHNPTKTTMITNEMKSSQGQITATSLQMRCGRSATLLDGVLTLTECLQLLEEAKKRGYEEALVNIGGGRQILKPDLRKGDRCIINDAMTAEAFFHRIREHLPAAKGLNNEKRLIGLSERMRFLAYNKGDYFKPHYDGSNSRPDGSASSWMTVMVYLDDGEKDFDGGRTLFLRESTGWGFLGDTLKIEHAIIPKSGRVLVFDHDMYHAGEDVAGGTKHCIRMDVMYAWPTR